MKEYLQNLKQELEQGKAQILDVREQDEWEQGHLQQAQFVPLSQLGEGHDFEKVNRSLKTYLYCRSGNRVQMAYPLLQSLGFEEVIPLNEGFEELSQEGFEV